MKIPITEFIGFLRRGYEQFKISKPVLLNQKLVVSDPTRITIELWGFKNDMNTITVNGVIKRVLNTKPYSDLPIVYAWREPTKEEYTAPPPPYPVTLINSQLFARGVYNEEFLMEYLNKIIKSFLEIRTYIYKKRKKLLEEYDYFIVNKSWNLEMELDEKGHNEYPFILIPTDKIKLEGLNYVFERDGIPCNEDFINKLREKGCKIIDFIQKDKELNIAEMMAHKHKLGEKKFAFSTMIED